MMQIRLKYKYSYTGKDKKYTNTKTHTHTQIQISLLGVLARSEEEKNEIFYKKSSHENGSNFCSRILSNSPRVPKRTYSTGLSTPKQD